MAESRAMMFLKLATQNGLITPEQAEQLLSAIEQRKELGVERTPAELAREKGFLSNEQIDKIESILRSTLPPDKVGGFQVKERIGQGAMGTVYRGLQLSLEKPVAVKILHQTLSSHPKFIRQFIQEARAAARLNHPNVVQAIDAGEDHGYNFFAMELIDGQTLRQKLKQGKIDEKTAIKIGAQVADGLQHAHDNGILHRDMKPDNILIGSDGQTKIADLGLAIPIDDTELLALEHKRMGTPYYLSPEQAEGREIDERADLYSLGATLYHAVAGKPLFTGNSVKEILTKQVHQAPIPLREAGAAVSEDFERVVMRLLEKNAGDRYGDARAVASALRGIGKGGKGPKGGASSPGSLDLDLELDLDLPSSSSSAARTAAAAAPGAGGRARRRSAGGGSQRTARRSPAGAASAGGATRRSAPRSSVRPSRQRDDLRLDEDDGHTVRSFRTRRQKTYTIAGGAVGGILALIFFLLAVSRHQEAQSTLMSNDERLEVEMAELDAKRTKARKIQWREKWITEKTARINVALEHFERKADGDVRLLLAGLWKTLEDNPDAPNSFELVERIEAIRAREIDRGKSRAEKEVFGPAEALYARGNLKAAMDKLDNIPDWPKDLRMDMKVREQALHRSADIQDELVRRFKDDIGRAKTLRNNKDYDKAIAVLDGIARYGSRTEIADAEAIRSDLIDLRDKHLVAQAEVQEKNDKNQYLSFARDVTSLCQERRFQTCIDKANDLKSSVETESVKRMIETDLAAFEVLQGFMQSFVIALGKTREKGRTVTIHLTNKSKKTGMFDKADADKIWLLLKRGAGSVSFPIDFTMITDITIFGIIEGHIGTKAEGYLVPLGVLAAYRGQFDVAKHHFSQAETQGHSIDTWVRKMNWRKRNAG